MTDEGPHNAVAAWLKAQWAQRPERFSVDVDGAPIACHGWNLDARGRPGVLLVHGFRAHAHWWDHIGPSLAAGRAVVALSLSGMGDSGRRERYGRRQFSRDMLGVAAACGLDRFILVAHSFGALAALMAVDEAPSSIARFIMIDAGLPVKSDPPLGAPVTPRRTYPKLEQALERFRLVPESASAHPLVRDYIARHSARRDEDGWTWKFDHRLAELLNQDGYATQVDRLTVPVDIVVAENTTIMTPDRVAEARRLSPYLERVVAIPASDHHIMIDQPVALVAALRALLA